MESATATLEQALKEVEKFKREAEFYRDAYLKIRREKWGSKSESFENSDQLVFNEIEVEGKKLEPLETETITYIRKKGRGKKKPYPESLEREELIVDLEECQKICPHDGTRLKKIGEDLTEKLKSYPAHHVVQTIRKFKYACDCCEGYMAQGKHDSVLPGTIASPEILSFIIFSKFFQSLPLYRLEELYGLSGIKLTRGTMARWLIQSSEKLMPIWNLLEEKMFEQGYMAIDATSIQVLKEQGRAPQLKSTMWARGSPELGIILFDYDQSGSGKVAKRLIEGFNGALQADAHPGYDQLQQQDLILLGCLMHSRRRFYQAWLGVKKNKESIAYEGLKYFQWIYKLESEFKEQAITPHQRKIIRDKEIRPRMGGLKNWCENQLLRVPKTSDIGNALNYYVTQYDELISFLRNGRFEIDNGWVERQIRRFAIGRKNWIFSDTVDGANASALLYSLALTAKLNGKNPYDVMVEVFKRRPKASTLEDYEELTNLLLVGYNPSSCRKKEGALIH